MPASQASRIIDLVKRHWRVFNPDGVRFPVIGYECDIDAGDTAPVTCGNVNYRPRESKIMETHVAALVDMGHIYKIETITWMSKAPLAPLSPTKRPSTISCISGGGSVSTIFV